MTAEAQFNDDLVFKYVSAIAVDGKYYATNATLAEYTGLSESTVKRSLIRLCVAGKIERIGWKKHATNRSTVLYQVIDRSQIGHI